MIFKNTQTMIKSTLYNILQKKILFQSIVLRLHRHDDTFVCSSIFEVKLVMVWYQLYKDFLVSLDCMDQYGPLWSYRISWNLDFIYNHNHLRHSNKDPSCYSHDLHFFSYDSAMQILARPLSPCYISFCSRDAVPRTPCLAHLSLVT